MEDKQNVVVEFHIRISQQMNPSTSLPKMLFITEYNVGFLAPAVLDMEWLLSLAVNECLLKAHYHLCLSETFLFL